METSIPEKSSWRAKYLDQDTKHDLVAGWIGGGTGIIVSNPFEVLKVRLQTVRVPSSRVGAGSRPTPSPTNPIGKFISNISSPSSTPSLPPPTVPPSSIPAPATPKPGFISLWRAEGTKFLFAGAAAPIVGLAFIDAAFFAGYGMSMRTFGQDRDDPAKLSRVFASGVMSGAVCALLQTPVEVIKCRAQAERLDKHGRKLGSWNITKLIASEGMRGFWIGGLMTAFRDGISSGIFFSGTFVGKRLLRGESPFSPSPDLDAIPKVFKDGRFNGSEIGRTFLAGGVAGLLSAVVPYPVDIIKTRLQTSTVQSKADHTTPAAPLTARSVARQIHRDGQEAFRYSYPTTRVYNFLSTSVFPPNTGPGCKLVDGRPVPNPKAEKWALRVLGLKGFTVGLRPTLVSSFVGSAVTITIFELTLGVFNNECRYIPMPHGIAWRTIEEWWTGSRT